MDKIFDNAKCGDKFKASCGYAIYQRPTKAGHQFTFADNDGNYIATLIVDETLTSTRYDGKCFIVSGKS